MAMCPREPVLATAQRVRILLTVLGNDALRVGNLIWRRLVDAIVRESSHSKFGGERHEVGITS